MLRETLWWPWSERKSSSRPAPGDEPGTPPNGPPDTKDVEALATSLNRSAERAQTLWLSFLTFTLYLAIAAGTTTHPMLFREDPLTLPVLNIALPLIGFHILAPLIFFVFHFYMLLNLVLLARTAKAFDDALQFAPLTDDARENFRMRIENTLFVQLLVGAKKEREGFNSWLLSLMALITLALAPVALLLFIQIRFLPYHSEGITWWHRGLLALDLLLVWTFWPGYRSGWGARLFPRTVWASALLIIWSVATLLYATTVANFPDEGLYVATKGLRERLGIAKSNGKPQRYAWLWPPNTLDLRNQNLIDDAKLKQLKEREASDGETNWIASLQLRDRNFVEADLSSADVEHADFSGANLGRAVLDKAWAPKAHLGCFNSNKTTGCVQLQGASLYGAQLQGADFNGVLAQEARFSSAHLQGADFSSALSQRANFSSAHLQGVSFRGAQLQGASFYGAQLQGAVLDANLEYAGFQGAQLQAAYLSGTYWKGADFGGANLRGTEISYGAKWLGSVRNDSLEEQLRNQPKDAEGATNEASDLDENGQLDLEAFSERGIRLEEASLAKAWRETGCVAEGAPFVVRSLMNRLHPFGSPFSRNSPERAKLAKDFLAPSCAGAKGLTDNEIAQLKAIAPAQAAAGGSTCAAAGGCPK